MIQDLITIIFFDPLLNALIFFYQVLWNNMGLAIIAVTLVLRLLIFPLNLRALVSQRKIQHLRPQLDALKTKHGDDRMAFSQAQLELYRTQGVNPLGGCFWLLIQLPFLFAIYAVFNFVVHISTIDELNRHLYSQTLHLRSLDDLHLMFGWVNLGQPDSLFIWPVLAGISQFALSRLSLPPLPAKKAAATDKVSFEETMVQTQRQMVYILPVITAVAALNFASGLAVYWTVGNVFSILQQLYVNRRHPAPTTTKVAVPDGVMEGEIVEMPARIAGPKPAKKAKKRNRR